MRIDAKYKFSHNRNKNERNFTNNAAGKLPLFRVCRAVRDSQIGVIYDFIKQYMDAYDVDEITMFGGSQIYQIRTVRV